jgi:outer membrane autotransporter protein
MRVGAVLAAGFAAAMVFSPGSAKADPQTHDGFFLRLGLNLGPSFTTAQAEVNGQEGPEQKLSGFTTGFDLLLGGSPMPGLVIGGGLLGATTSNPTIEVGDIEGEGDGTLIFGAAAAFANYYFDPKQGLHIQGLVGFAVLDAVSSEGTSGGNDPTGIGLGLGIGYDFWISDEWSIGPFGRVLYGSLSASEGPLSVGYTYLYPNIGVAFTLH